MDFKQKDMVLLPYPFTNLQQTKVRPALIVSNDNFNKNSIDLIMVPLTSVLKDTPHSLLITQQDLDSGTLIKTSEIRVDKIFTVQKSIIIKRIGKINDSRFTTIKQKLMKNL